MKIAQIAPVEETVPPRKYGGTELVISNITNELVSRGHEVDLYASGDSRTSANLIPLTPKAIRVLTQDIGKDKVREVWKYISIGELFSKINQKKYDVVHQHIGWRLTPFEQLINAPVVATCHGPLSDEYIQTVYSRYKNNNYISISDNQRKDSPDLNFISTVHNGIDLHDFTFSKKSENYYAFLGRMSPEKGPKEAILIAKKAGIKLKMAAKVDAIDIPYFNREIKPLIDGNQIEFIGEIGPTERNSFLGKALGLLAPIQWEEPFGLFIIEAMAVGTPVIGTNRGSFPEIIIDRQTGFLVNNIDEAVNAISKINTINRLVCRKHIENNFTISKMTDGYEKVYRILADGIKK